MVVAGAALIFGERVGWQRWLAVLVGFAGVLVILRPGADFSALSLLAVVGLLGFAGRDLATRAAPKGLSNRQLGALGLCDAGDCGGDPAGGSGRGDGAGRGRRWRIWLGGAVFGMLGYHALTYAMRTGEVSVGHAVPLYAADLCDDPGDGAVWRAARSGDLDRCGADRGVGHLCADASAVGRVRPGDRAPPARIVAAR